MSITITCSAEHAQPWAVVTGTRKAHPGRQSPTTMVSVPNEDIYGTKLGGASRVPSGRWMPDGPSADMARTETATEVIYSWACLCGAELSYVTPRLERVDCTHGAGTRGTCWKRGLQTNPPSDLYVNPRYGGACPCCGHQGTHLVRVDRQGVLPSCLSQVAAG